MEVKLQFVQPKIFHLAQTTLDHTGAVDFLKFLGVPDWYTDAPSETEALLEIAGRSCYKSFGTELNKNLTKVRDSNKDYISNVINKHDGSVLEHGLDTYVFVNVSRIFCFTPDTEILTTDGWKNIVSLTKQDKILTKESKTGDCVWEFPKNLYKFPYSGKIHWYESSQWKSPAFTPEHVQWGAKYDLRKNRNKSLNEIIKHAEKITFSNLNYKRFVVDHTIKLKNSLDPKTIKIGSYTYNAEIFFLFLGIWITDGSIAKDRNAVNITQIKSNNRDTIRFIMKTLFQNRFKEYNSVFRISDPDLKTWLVNNFGRTKDQIRLTYLYNFSARLLAHFYKGALLGDGNKHKKNGHEVIYCGYKNQAKDYQTILAMIGRSSNIRVDDRRGQSRILNGNIITNKLINYIISVHNDGESLIKKEHYKQDNFNGFVYCPQTLNGLVFVRRDGMPVWSGNTHELVRHRLSGYSQESLRFVRLDNLSVYYPDVFENHPENETLREAFMDVYEDAENIQRSLAKLLKLDMLNFEEKKLLTSAMRRLAPDGLATMIVMTTNHRNWRWLVEMRTSPYAEEEIRKVFVMVYDDLKSRYPNIYFDAIEETVNNIRSIKFRNSKV